MKKIFRLILLALVFTTTTALVYDKSVYNTVSVESYGKNISSALTSIGSTTCTLTSASTYTLTQNTVIPANVSFNPQPGTRINSGGYTLAINGPFSAGMYQVFYGFAEVTFGPNSSNSYLPIWTGNTGGMRIIGEIGSDIKFEQVIAPTGLSIALGDTGVLNGTYTYAMTYVTSDGETDCSGETGQLSVNNKKINLSNIAISTDPRVVARRIYRTIGNPVDFVLKQLVVEISDNTTTTYIDNVADGSLGVPVLRSNTTGANIWVNGDRVGVLYGGTTVLGKNAHINNTGYANTAIGFSALSANTTGLRNVGVGVYALTANTTGFENSATGVHSLNYNTTGSANTAVGYMAGMNNLVGIDNTVIGNMAGASGLGGRNTIVGAKALLQNTQAVDAKNTAIGAYAGWNNVSGIGNVFIGHEAGFRFLGNNHLIIDTQDRGTEDDESNKALIYGIFDPAISSQMVKINGRLRSSNSSAYTANRPSSTIPGTEISEAGDYLTSTGTATVAHNTHIFYNGTGLVGAIQTNGEVTTYASLSDIRAKENIIPATAAMDKLLAIKIRQFDWKETKKHVDYGLIAQELNEVYPSVVNVGSGDTPWMIDNAKLVPLLIKTIQELSERIKVLEEK